MIPTFPKFKHLEWNDRADVQQFTSCFPPYSDFNFVSMWSWNTRDKMMLSQLYGNLILLFYDYITEKPFLSFIGKYNLTDTAHMLLEYSEVHYERSMLKLISEEVARNLSQSEFSVKEDDDAHDYIISVAYLNTLETLPNSHKAGYKYRQFLNSYPGHTIQACPTKDSDKKEYIGLFKRWAQIRNLDHWELNEYSAFEKFIGNNENDNHIVSLHEGNKMMGFVTYEILPNKYAICHFAKADKDYSGVYDGLFFAVGKVLKEAGVSYWNFEQDLGIPIRQAKRKYRPEFYLKKFTVERKIVGV